MGGRPAAEGPDGAAGLRERLRGALPAAIKARDAAAVAALRSALAAVDNAEAADAAQAPPGAVHADLAGTVAGVGAAEVARRRLSEAQVVAIVRAELAEREAAARDYERAGHRPQAERLRAEAGVLGGYLDGADPSG
jgi:uncharacterized protein